MVDRKMSYVEKELQYIPGKTHVKEVCATLSQAHKLQIGTQLLQGDHGYCYISDGAESQQTEYLAQLLSDSTRRRRQPADNRSRPEHAQP
eukprot:6196047-Pleurochrysis_carterae.AAC.5